MRSWSAAGRESRGEEDAEVEEEVVLSEVEVEVEELLVVLAILLCGGLVVDGGCGSEEVLAGCGYFYRVRHCAAGH